MNRRAFMTTSATAVAAASTAGTTLPAAEEKGGELYELTAYSMEAKKLPLLDAYLEKALLPRSSASVPDRSASSSTRNRMRSRWWC